MLRNHSTRFINRLRQARFSSSSSSSKTPEQPPATPPPAPAGPPASTGAQQSAGNKFEARKYARPLLLLFGLGFTAYNLLLNTDNPQSWINRTLQQRGKNKFRLKVERLDDQIAQYRTAYVSTSMGLKEALKRRTREQQSHDVGINVDLLTDEQVAELNLIAMRAAKVKKLEDELFKVAYEEQKGEMRGWISSALLAAFKSELRSLGAKDPESSTEKTQPEEDDISGVSLTETLQSLLEQRLKTELCLLRDLHNLFEAEPKTAHLLATRPDVIGKLKNRILGLSDEMPGLVFEHLKTTSFLPMRKQPRVFVLHFQGDMMASQVQMFREEVTALLSIADPKRDEVLIRLNSTGGTVTGYGLAAAQIARMKEKGFQVNVAIDEVAASGGYLMAAVADKIYCSPFAMVGSIGVIMTMPNVAERLTREGISVEDITAGKYKRTLTPYKKPTYEDRSKVKEDVENVLVLFKSFLRENRPHLNVDELATGEIWHGSQALKLGLVDEIKTYDDLLLNYVDQFKEVYLLSVKPSIPRFPSLDEENMSILETITTSAVQWLQTTIARALRNALFKNEVLGQDIPSPYMAEDSHYTPVMAMDPVYSSRSGPRL